METSIGKDAFQEKRDEIESLLVIVDFSRHYPLVDDDLALEDSYMYLFKLFSSEACEI